MNDWLKPSAIIRTRVGFHEFGKPYHVRVCQACGNNLPIDGGIHVEGFLACSDDCAERCREVTAALKPLDNLADRIGVITAGCRDKEPDQLSDQERIALAIIGGCAWEFTGTGIRVTDEFGIQKIDGEFRIVRRAPVRVRDEVSDDHNDR